MKTFDFTKIIIHFRTAEMLSLEFSPDTKRLPVALGVKDFS